MANSADSDMRRAKEYRAMAKSAKDPGAKATFEATAARMERRAAQKASRAGRRKPKKKAV